MPTEERFKQIEARLAVLEKVAVTGEAEETPDPDKRFGRIMNIIEKLAHRVGEDNNGMRHYSFRRIDLELAIRKSLNEFYRGPYAPVDERITALTEERDNLLREKSIFRQRAETAEARLAAIEMVMKGDEDEAVTHYYRQFVAGDGPGAEPDGDGPRPDPIP